METVQRLPISDYVRQLVPIGQLADKIYAFDALDAFGAIDAIYLSNVICVGDVIYARHDKTPRQLTYLQLAAVYMLRLACAIRCSSSET